MSEIIARGIDISSHQGTVDFAKVKAAGYTYVIIKAGQGLREMVTFRRDYLPAVLAAGLDWGAYWWSDASDADEAQQEALAFVKTLDGLRPTYPVYMDQEYDSLCGRWGVGTGKQRRTNMVNAFCAVVEDAGYYTGLYASKDWLENWVDVKQLPLWDKWVAQYANRCTYTGSHGMWQHHGDVPGFVGRCDGITVPVDLNDCYRDYPALIKGAGLNGWGTPDEPVTPPAEPSVYTLHLSELRAQGVTEIKIIL